MPLFAPLADREWRNGITEEHVNRLTFLKRHIFGRAHLDLLRIKVLHAVKAAFASCDTRAVLASLLVLCQALFDKRKKEGIC